MKLNIDYSELCDVLEGQSLSNASPLTIDHVSCDSRKIADVENTAFFALNGEFRDGHAFIADAYEKGVRVFVISEQHATETFPDAHFILVENTLDALQRLAAFHRNKFDYPIVAITGSAGKTTVKEWLFHLLSPELRVIRSPKSYNSQLGVALSLLELHEDADLALIEAGISLPGEMERLETMIRPTIGVFTSFGRAHEENFKTVEQHLDEKLKLFTRVQKTFYPETIRLSAEQKKAIHGVVLKLDSFKREMALVPFDDKASQSNALVSIALAKLFLEDTSSLKQKISSLPQLALRMEILEGANGNTLINDTYNLDLDGLTQSLEYQLRVAGNRKRVVIVGLDEANFHRKKEVEEIVDAFHPDETFIIHGDERLDVAFFNSVILIKGTRKADMERFARQLRLKNHKTYVEIDLSAVRHNLSVFKSYMKPETKLLAMVKAQSYGSGVEKMAAFLEQQGVNYLGVAYCDEGVELRKQGIKLPILIMNAEEEGFEDCIHYNLEPALYSFHQMDLFIKELILHGVTNHPVHLKFDTGMKRLGFELEEMPKVCEIIRAQPEIRVKTVYSHLVDADNRRDKRFTMHQLQKFEQGTKYIREQLNYPIDRHILNSEGITAFSDFQFEMVRLGIGMYGLTSNPVIQPKLKPVMKWMSAVSQVKTLHKGESVGYNRTFIADKEMKSATVAVGYADGFRRSLGNSNFGVYINGKYCRTLGRVCMDMVMVDVTNVKVLEGDQVEIIGPQQPIGKIAEKMGTIAYEVMTGISKRVPRIYLEE